MRRGVGCYKAALLTSVMLWNAGGYANAADPKNDLHITGQFGSGSYLSAFADLRTLPPLDSIECPTTDADPKAPDLAILSLRDAIAHLQGFLRETESAEALSALDASPEVRDPRRAVQLAVISLADRRAGAAMALLIKAYQDSPDEPGYLVSLAGVANYAGKYEEALALITAAEAGKKIPTTPDGIDGRAALLNNKGDALLGLGRAHEAELVFRAALAIQPDLSELNTNLAYALGDQGKCKEAVRAMRAGAFRKKSKDEKADRLPLEQALDISRGKPGIFPIVPLPPTPENALAVNEQWVKRALQPAADPSPAIEAMHKRYEVWKKAGTSGRLTAERARLLEDAVEEFTSLSKYQYAHDAEIDRLNREYIQAQEALKEVSGKADKDSSAAADEIDHDIATRQNACHTTACEKTVDEAGRRAMCNVGYTYAGKVRSAAQEYDRALRVFFRESYRRASSAASYFSDPTYQTWARLRLKQFQDLALLDLLEHEHDYYQGPIGQLGSQCLPQTADANIGDEQSAQAMLCEALQGMKLKVEAEVMEMSVSCEEVEVGVATPGFIGMFGQVGYQFGSGKTTVFAGGQAELKAMGAGVNGKTGGYFVIDANGNISDVGVKGELKASAAMHLGPVSMGREVDLGAFQMSCLSSRPGI